MNSAANPDRNQPSSALGDTNRSRNTERVVILGASNVMRGISTVVATAELFRGQPLDILAAAGHGRSYGLRSRVLGRALPAITSCALWDALAERPPATTVSLVTDIGNDLLYGASVDSIVGWVDQCLQRLAPLSDQLIMTELPLENIGRLNPATFLVMRSVLFPKSRLTLAAASEMSVELNERVERLATDYDATLIKPKKEWYGADPIHVHRRFHDPAWQQILSSWKTAPIDLTDAPSRNRRIPLNRCRPHVRWFVGIEQRRAQPALRLPSGTQLSFF